MIWQQLIKAALIGTGRSNLPEELEEELTRLGIDETAAPEKKLLHAAAIYSRMYKAASRPLQWTAPLADPSETTNTGICSREGSRLLVRILDGEYPELLPEFIHNLEERELFLPPETLPGLLQRAVEDKKLWAQLKSVIGKRGFWLIDLNPAWKVLSFRHDPDVWSLGGSAERLAFLQYLRRNAPEKAIELLVESWEEESHQDRLRFLQALELNLRASDELFLESCLDSTRKDIRKAAARLLSLIPDTKLIEPMKTRLGLLIELKERSAKKPKILLSLPEKCDKEMVRDGIDPRKQWNKGGVKASRFLQMMSLIPPSYWEHLFEQSAAEVLATFVRSEWSTLLVQAALDASCLHEDTNWMKGLLEFWVENHYKERWEGLKVAPMLDKLPAFLLNEFLIETLKKGPKNVEVESPVVLLLRLPHHPWEDKLMMQFIKNLKNWINASGNRHWGHWHLRELLKNAAYRCRPELYDYFHQRWPRNDAAWSGWYDEIEEFLYVLKFRKKMKEVI